MATPGTQLEKSPPAPVPVQTMLLKRLNALWALSRVRWAAMLPGQRRWAVVAALMVTALMGSLLWYGFRTEWRTLYTNLEGDDQRQVAQVLTNAQIPFEITPDGMGIRVPATYLDKARLASAAKSSLKSGRMGFEIFDKPNWVGSEFDEQVNFQRALEGELEHTLSLLSDVDSARVHLVMAHDSLFREAERPAKASVELKLRRRSLADGEPEAIRNLVASAVDGLTPERVVLVDADGHLPLGPKTPEALRFEAEQALEEKLIATLEPVTGHGNVRASVTIEYNPVATEETNESYDPARVAPLTVQKSEQSTGAKPVAAGVPGTASNTPNGQAQPVYPQQTSAPENAKSESESYAVSKVTRKTMEAPGKIRRMTAAIVVNDRLIAAAANGKPAQWQTRSASELQNLTTLAQAAVGYDVNRGDQLAIADLPFDTNRPVAPLSAVNQWLARVESSPVLVKYAVMLVCVLAILVLGIRPAIKRARGKGPEAARKEDKVKGKDGLKEPAKDKTLDAGQEKLLGTMAGAHAQLADVKEEIEIDPERQRAQEILDQVSAYLKREPTQSSRLLQSWIHSD